MTPADFAIGLAALGALLLPGWLVARALRLTQPIVAGLIGSTLAWFGVIFALTLCGVSLTRGPLAVAWTIVTALAMWWAIWAQRLNRSSSIAANAAAAPLSPWREHWPLFLPLLPAVAVVAYRACAQPLFGVDTVFRWNYLAEQMLARGTLDFYPPVTGADYEIYAWPDGIAPAVSSLYFAIYRLAGSARPTLTAPLIVFQFVTLLLAVHALARREFSPRAAAFACALVAASPVILWASAMGQESALLAIAVVAMLLYLPRQRAEHGDAAAVFAGIAAGLAALAREYGLVFPVVGVALCAARRLPRRCGVLFALGSIATAAPWYLRNWVRTGNPLFNLKVGDLFPINAVHDWLQQSFQMEFGWASLPATAGQVLLGNCAVALLAGGMGAALHFRSARGSIAVTVVCIAMWALAVGYTAAGFTYALRVLCPALALASIPGGAAFAHWIPGRRHLTGAVLAASLLAGDAALRALTLPANVYRLPASAWLEVGNAVHDYHARPIYAEIARVAGPRRILVLGPNALLTTRGARTLPLWSQEVPFLFAPDTPASEVARRLLAANIGFVLLNRGAVNERFLAHSPFFREPGSTLQPLWSDADMILLAIVAPVGN